MTKLLTQNSKMTKSSKGAYLVVNFGIPAYKAADGTVTCPLAGKCGETGGCYALQGSYTWTPVRAAYEYRLAVTKRADFEQQISVEIDRWQRSATRKGMRLAVRVHDSGDYYTLEYFLRWQGIAWAYPDVIFYSYTKMVPFVTRATRPWRRTNPPNFTYILSEGGKMDSRIGNHRHSRVFSSVADLEAAGYGNATADDTVAFTETSGKIGLVYHGYKSKTWTTSEAAA